MMKAFLIIGLFLCLACCHSKSTCDEAQHIKLGMPKAKVIELIGYPSLVKNLGEEDLSGKNMEFAIYDKLVTIVYDHDLVVEVVIKKSKEA